MNITQPLSPRSAVWEGHRKMTSAMKYSHAMGCYEVPKEKAVTLNEGRTGLEILHRGEGSRRWMMRKEGGEIRNYK